MSYMAAATPSVAVDGGDDVPRFISDNSQERPPVLESSGLDIELEDALVQKRVERRAKLAVRFDYVRFHLCGLTQS